MKWLRKLWFDQRGDDQPAGGDVGAAGGDPSADPAAGDPNLIPDPNAAGQGDVTPPTPKFGEFGDTPQTIEEALALADKMYQGYNKIKPEHEMLRTKTAATERNLSSLRKTLESSGIRAIADEEGNLKLEVVDKPQATKTRRFQDTHKALFDQKVLEAIDARIQDMFEDQLETRERSSQENQKKVQAFVSAKKEANDLMIAYFPQLEAGFDVAGKPTNKEFNEAFYNRATEIWQERYRNTPQGELIAAMIAARELGIVQQSVQAAKIQGVQLGKDGKKILAPVVGSGAKPAGQSGAMTKEQYLALSAEDRDKIDKQKLGIK